MDKILKTIEKKKGLGSIDKKFLRIQDVNDT